MKIEVGGFLFTDKGVAPINDKVRPTKQGWLAAIAMANGVEHASQFWPGDLLEWLETQSGWSEDVQEQLRSTANIARQTTYNRRSVAKHVSPAARAIAPTFGHAAAVASLEPKDQVAVLREAVDEELNVYQTRKRAKSKRRPRIVEGQAELHGKYRVVYANPSWDDTQLRDIKSAPVEAHAMKHAVCFLWTPAGRLPDGLDVLAAWGFEYSTSYVWDMVNGSEGTYAVVQHAHLLVGVRGTLTPDVSLDAHTHSSIVRIKRNPRDAEKPDAFRVLIEKLFTVGPRLELFSRESHEGWSSFGNDTGAWEKTA